MELYRQNLKISGGNTGIFWRKWTLFSCINIWLIWVFAGRTCHFVIFGSILTSNLQYSKNVDSTIIKLKSLFNFSTLTAAIHHHSLKSIKCRTFFSVSTGKCSSLQKTNNPAGIIIMYALANDVDHSGWHSLHFCQTGTGTCSTLNNHAAELFW